MKEPLIALAALAAFAVPARTVEPVTFNKDVAPILWKNCASCHVQGAVGPFSLVTYQDAVRRAKFIRDITASRRMPLASWTLTARSAAVFFGRRLLSRMRTDPKKAQRLASGRLPPYHGADPRP